MNDIPDMRGINETAKNFGEGVTPHYIRQLALSGKVAAVRIGRGKILVCQQSVARFFAESRIPNDDAESCSDIQPIPRLIGR